MSLSDRPREGSEAAPWVVEKVKALEAEVRQLRGWKETWMVVEREWDAHAIARMLGARPGDVWRRVIAKKVPQLITERNEAVKAIGVEARKRGLVEAELDRLHRDRELIWRAGYGEAVRLIAKHGLDPAKIDEQAAWESTELAREGE